MTAFVRSAIEKDLETVSSLLGRTWHATYDGLYGNDEVAKLTSSWHSVEALQNQLKAPHSEFLVADTGEAIVGMAYARTTHEDTAHLFQLYVDPPAQGTGLGRALLEELMGCFPAARGMVLEVADRNEKAIGFYTHHGFVEADRNSENGIETVVLERPI